MTSDRRGTGKGYLPGLSRRTRAAHGCPAQHSRPGFLRRIVPGPPLCVKGKRGRPTPVRAKTTFVAGGDRTMTACAIEPAAANEKNEDGETPRTEYAITEDGEPPRTECAIAVNGNENGKTPRTEYAIAENGQTPRTGNGETPRPECVI